MPEDRTSAQPLPMTRAEMDRRGWDSLDILLVTGDAYVDHPAFGVALLGRLLEREGYRVGIVAQPRWQDDTDVARLGRPRLFAGVTAGALDSMLAHYTAFRKRRNDDAYTPGGQHGARPNRASIVYTGLIRHAFPGLPVVLGGIEASLRRTTHYDFWADKVRRSILLDSKADMIVYGMGERAIVEIASRLDTAPDDANSLRGIPGTVVALSAADWQAQRETLESQGIAVADLPSHEDIQSDPRELMTATTMLEAQVHEGATWAAQACGGRVVAMAPPAAPLEQGELDALYDLPFTRAPHPSYAKPIPAVAMIQFSVTSHRGCAGGCSFCSLALHQGRRIQSRSARSIRAEVRRLTRHPNWRGSVTDVGGPTANLWGARCAVDVRGCRRPSCLTPDTCPHFRSDQAELARLLKGLAALPGVDHLRVASGVRHDVAMRDPDYVRTLLHGFVGGQLKLAPEHCADRVLRLMRKPDFQSFEAFLSVFERESRMAGKEQYVVPYLMTAFPGCTDEDMRSLANWLRARGWKPRQVQCFIPTPGTVATAMYHAGVDTGGSAVPVARTDADRLRQHRILMPETGTKPRRGRRQRRT